MEGVVMSIQKYESDATLQLGSGLLQTYTIASLDVYRGIFQMEEEL